MRKENHSFLAKNVTGYFVFYSTIDGICHSEAIYSKTTKHECEYLIVEPGFTTANSSVKSSIEFLNGLQFHLRTRYFLSGKIHFTNVC